MAFEYGEQTDSSGNIIHVGSWGVKSSPKDSIPIMIENFRVLKDENITSVESDAKYAPLASPTLTGIVTTAGQIKFPATANPSTDVNTLDDYREGTFTPTVIGATTAGVGTYTTQTGHYTKIGRVVYFDILLVWTAHTGTGGTRIGGLPFVSLAGSNFLCNIESTNMTYTYSLTALVLANTATIGVRQVASGVAVTECTIDTTVDGLRISGMYFTN